MVALATMAAFSGVLEIKLLIAGLSLFTFAAGVTMPNAVTEAMNGVPQAAGVGAALVGKLQFVTGAASAALLGFIGAGSVAAMCGVMAAATAAGLALMVAMEMRRPDRT